MSRPDSSPSGAQTAKRVTRGSSKKDSDADDASPRNHRRSKPQKKDVPAPATSTADDENPVEVRRTEAPTVAVSDADDVRKASAAPAPVRTSIARRTRAVVTTAVVTTPHVEAAQTEVVDLEKPPAPAEPDAPADTGLWTMLSAAGRESRRTLFNRRPVLDNQQVDVTLDEYDDVSVPIAFNGTDADGDPLTYRVRRGLFGPKHGTVTVDPATGTFTYDADNEFALTGGRDRFLVRVSDYNSDDFHLHGLFGGHSDWAVITVNVAATDRAPVAGNDSVHVDEDGLLVVDPADLLANDTDIDRDNLSIDGYTQPEHGDLWINRDGTISYDPDDDYNGTDTFTYTVTDGLTTATATVTVTVNPVDDAPVITGVNVGAGDPASAEVRGSVTATDPDGGTITYSAPTTTQYGTVTIDPDTGAFVYTPNEESRGGGAGNGGTITFSDPAQVTLGTFASTALGLNDLSDLTGRGATRNYIATSFTATATQSYTLGQSQAPEDTLMIVYSGPFDPDSPETGALVLNDDAGIHAVPVTGCGGAGSFCPEVTLDLVAGQRVSIVVTTWAADRPLGLPQTFYATGPGGFGTTPQEDTFVVTATDSSGATATVSVTVPITPLPAGSAL